MKTPSTLSFRLYVAGDTQNSSKAIFNLNAFCRLHLAGRHVIEIVDVFKEPLRALEDNILLTPTLVRLTPLPVMKVIGSLNDPAPLLNLLDQEVPSA